MRLWLVGILGVILAGITYSAYQFEVRGIGSERLAGVQPASQVREAPVETRESILDGASEEAAEPGEQQVAAVDAGADTETTAEDQMARPAAEAEDTDSDSGNVPTFDVVSVDPDGTAVVAGRAMPGAEVTLQIGERSIGSAIASDRGEWVIVPDQPIPGGAQTLSLAATMPASGETVESDQVATVVLPETAGSEVTGSGGAGESQVAEAETGPVSVPPVSSGTDVAGSGAGESQIAEAEAGDTVLVPSGSAGSSVTGSGAGESQIAETQAGDTVLVPSGSAASSVVASGAGESQVAQAETGAVAVPSGASGSSVAGSDTASSETAEAESGTVSLPSGAAQEVASEASTPPPAAPSSGVAVSDSTPAPAPTPAPVAEVAPRAKPAEPETVVASEASPGTVAEPSQSNADETETVVTVNEPPEAAEETADAEAGEGAEAGETIVASVPDEAAEETETPVAVANVPEATPRVLSAPATPEAPAEEQTAAPAEPATPAEEQAVAAAEPATPAGESGQPRETIVVVSEPGEPSRVLQGASEAEEERPPITFDSVDYDDRGRVIVAGQVEAGADVRAYIDNQLLGDARADEGGRWTLRATRHIDPGAYELRVDRLDPSGLVIARARAPFERVAPDVVAAARERGEVVIQPGDNLWNLSRAIYGEGMLYTVIYGANTNQISDPDLIYPGQLLVTPGSPGLDRENAAEAETVGTAG